MSNYKLIYKLSVIVIAVLTALLVGAAVILAVGGEVQRASVRLKTDICPECGRTYISGGVTTTQIKYYNESNPYQKDMKESDAANKYRGANVDMDQ